MPVLLHCFTIDDFHNNVSITYNYELNLMSKEQTMQNLYEYDLIEMLNNKSCFI